MSSKVGNRRSPSGPPIVIQLPYYNTDLPLNGGTHFVQIAASGTAQTAELGTEYQIPVGNPLTVNGTPTNNAGRLDTLQITNNPIAATDTSNVVYQVRKNGANVGPSLTIANNNVGPVKIDLSNISVSQGDLISISVTSGLLSDSPEARIFLSWLPQSGI